MPNVTTESAEEKVARLEREVADMRNALRPFSELATEYDATFGRRSTTCLATAVGSLDPKHLRAARTVLRRHNS